MSGIMFFKTNQYAEMERRSRMPGPDGDFARKYILERLRAEVPEQINHCYTPITKCEKCGSVDLTLVSLFKVPNFLQLRYRCNECGYSRALATDENLKKRNNTQLQKWAHSVKEKYGWKCALCGSKENLEAHHIIPVSNDPEMRFKYDVNNGIALCKEHHDMVHPWRQNDAEAQNAGL